MSLYTTGEVAKLCGITVRTVQYYDSRNILSPSTLSEGGRRLYSEDDVKRMKVICFLRDLGLSLNTIGQLLREDHPEDVIDLLLEQQEKELTEEIQLRQIKLDKLEDLRKIVKRTDNFSLHSFFDIANMMENKKKMRKIRWTMAIVGVALEAVEVGCILLGVLKGIWWPAIPGAAVFVAGLVWLVRYYYKKVDYICPKCHQVFKPTFGAMFFANHTATTRKLTCTACGHKGFCVETYSQK